MKLIDFDGMFDEKLTQYMEENKNKYTEKEWEDVIPRLYKKFGDTYVAKVKCTPKEYYAKMSDTELVETLRAHLQTDVPIPEFLCAETERRDVVETLLSMLFDDTQSAVYALNLIGDDARAYDAYFTLLEKETTDEDLKNDVIEIFKYHADAVKERVLNAYEKKIAPEAMLEILSRVKERDERVYAILLSAFQEDENLAMRASFLAAYGDERALPVLLKRIEDETLGFVQFQELKYAIEALGGEYNEPRDFTGDSEYLAVEASAQKAMRNENENFRS
jgi:hypothetical protein